MGLGAQLTRLGKHSVIYGLGGLVSRVLAVLLVLLRGQVEHLDGCHPERPERVEQHRAVLPQRQEVDLDGRAPPADAVRVEEMINYFDYGYARPIRVGAAGGLGTPESVASAFALGAAYVLTGFRQHFVNESRPATAEETENGLPHSFRVLEHVCGGGRVYKTYHGPSGQKFRSIRQVTRANPSSPAE